MPRLHVQFTSEHPPTKPVLTFNLSLRLKVNTCQFDPVPVSSALCTAIIISCVVFCAVLNICMGFLDSYLRLPRYQRVLLGLAGVTLGWYGPSLMQYIFVEPGLFRFNRVSPPPLPKEQSLALVAEEDDHQSNRQTDARSFSSKTN